MNTYRLEIANQEVHLYPGQAIEYIIENNLLNPIVTDTAFTLPFSGPWTNQNTAIFGHLYLPEQIGNLQAEYSATLFLNDTPYRTGSLKFTRITPRGFELQFQTDGLLSREDGNKLVQQYLTEVVTVATEQSAGNIVRPTLYMEDKLPIGSLTRYQHILNHYDSGSLGSFHTPAIAMKMSWILEKLIVALGFTYTEFYSANWPDIDDLIIINNTMKFDTGSGRITGPYGNSVLPSFYTVPTTIELGEYIPEITVSDFLNSIGSALNLVFIFKNDTCEVHHVGTVIDSTNYSDYTEQVTPNYELTPSSIQGIRASFSGASADNQLDRDDITFGADVASVADLAAPAIELDNTVVLVLEENTYYRMVWNADTSSGAWEFFEVNVYGWDTGSEPRIELNSKAKILKNKLFFEWKVTGASITNNGSGKVRLNFSQEDVPYDYYRDVMQAVTIWKLNVPYLDGNYTILADTFTSIDIDVNYVQDEDGVEFTIYAFYGRSVPFIDVGYHSDFHEELNRKYPLILAFYHGMVEEFIFTDQFAYASASNYDLKGNKLSAFALRWEGTEGLLDTLFKNYLAAAQGAEVVYLAAFTHEEIRQLSRTTIMRIRENRYLLKKLEASLRNRQPMEPVRLTLTHLRRIQ